MNERLKMARHLLSPQGALVISIGYQEIHNLNLLCQDIFFDRQIVTVTVQTSGGKPNGGFNYTQEYLLFVVPVTFSPSAMNFTGGIERSPFEGLTLSTFDKITRPNQTYKSKITSAQAMETGLALPEGGDFSSRWSSISAGENS